MVDLGKSLKEEIGHSFGNLTIAWLLLHRNQYIIKIPHNRLIWKASFDFDMGVFLSTPIRRRLTPFWLVKQAAFSEWPAALKRRFQPDVPGWCRMYASSTCRLPTNMSWIRCSAKDLFRWHGITHGPYLSKLSKLRLFELSGCYFIDKDIARAYNSKNLCLLISQIFTDNVGR